MARRPCSGALLAVGLLLPGGPSLAHAQRGGARGGEDAERVAHATEEAEPEDLGSTARRWPANAPVREGVLVRRGRHYELHLQFDAPRAAELAIRALEATWPVAMELLGTPEHEPAYLLEVHLYDDKRHYERVDAWLTGGNFQSNESFSHWNSLTAHVVMAPPLGAVPAQALGLTSQTLEVLVHEAAHLAVYTVIPTYRWHPTWFSEGLAMWIERETLRRLGLLGDPAAHPRYATQELQAQRLLAAGRVPPLRKVLVDDVPELGFHERYALWNELFCVLRAGGDERFAGLVEDLRSLRGGASLRRRFAGAVLARYDEATLEQELAARLAEVHADWVENLRSLETIGDEWEQVAFPSSEALAWRTRPVEAESFSLRGALVRFEPSDRMRVLLGSRSVEPGGGPYLAVGFEEGRLTVLWHHGSSIPPTRLGRVRSERLAAGEEVAFEVRVDGAHLSILLDGVDELSLDLGERDVRGPWGLGVSRGGAGLWRRVALGAR